MRRLQTLGTALAAGLVAWTLMTATPRAQNRREVRVTASANAAVQRWSAQIAGMVRSGDLQLARVDSDGMLPWRTHERYQQYYQGVPVFGGDLVAELDDGTPVSIMGQLQSEIDLDPVPRLTAAEVKRLVEERCGVEIGERRAPVLTVLPNDDGEYVLAYDVQVFANGDLTRYFIDANTGEVALQYSNLQTQAATAVIGKGTGTLSDTKKVSAGLLNGLYYTTDLMRPAVINTYDMRGNYLRALSIVNGVSAPTFNDLAIDADNVWTDGAVVDSQVYAGYVYNYYYTQMGRKGINDNNMTVRLFVHPAYRQDYGSLLGRYPDFFVNAFWDGYEMVFGDGLPPDVTLGGSRFNYFSAAIDVVAHELTHGVTQYTSNLEYRNEPGALNEAFSDIMGAGVEFAFQPRAADVVNGSGPLQADYLLGEDMCSTPTRSMARPAAYGQPDHYSNRYTGTSDNGGVHRNSGIANNAYYLAVEGGVNATSGRAVQGVGAANHLQIEKIFYRAFAYKLTSKSNFSTARTATIQAARELYGRGSAPETAIIQAWDAVGVDVGAIPAYSGDDAASRRGVRTRIR